MIFKNILFCWMEKAQWVIWEYRFSLEKRHVEFIISEGMGYIPGRKDTADGRFFQVHIIWNFDLRFFSENIALLKFCDGKSIDIHVCSVIQSVYCLCCSQRRSVFIVNWFLIQAEMLSVRQLKERCWMFKLRKLALFLWSRVQKFHLCQRRIYFIL